MDKVYAYIDESGAYGFDFTKENNSELFIVSAIIIAAKDVPLANSVIERVREEDFSGSEIKSNRIKGDNKRRVKVLRKCLQIPFSVLTLIVDKKSVFSDSGIAKSKKTFYKFVNQLLYNELRGVYTRLSIITDEVGHREYADEFVRYVKNNRVQRSLFDEEYFEIVDSKENNLVQLADLISGTVAYVYEPRKRIKVPQDIDYLKMLDKKLSKVSFFPQSYDDNLFQHEEGDDTYSKDIALTVNRLAANFIATHGNAAGEDKQRQLFVLKYLHFRFKYNSLRKYISTKELMNAMERTGFPSMNQQAFRSRVIGKLRDAGVIISSSANGYKLPSSEKEIYDYYHHVNSIIVPMIQRLNVCNDELKLASGNFKNFLANVNLPALKEMSEALKRTSHL